MFKTIFVFVLAALFFQLPGAFAQQGDPGNDTLRVLTKFKSPTGPRWAGAYGVTSSLEADAPNFQRASAAAGETFQPQMNYPVDVPSPGFENALLYQVTDTLATGFRVLVFNPELTDQPSTEYFVTIYPMEFTADGAYRITDMYAMHAYDTIYALPQYGGDVELQIEGLQTPGGYYIVVQSKEFSSYGVGFSIVFGTE